jgi:hypothetical protein
MDNRQAVFTNALIVTQKKIPAPAGFVPGFEALRGMMTNASDEREWNEKSSGKICLHTDADLERVRKA